VSFKESGETLIFCGLSYDINMRWSSFQRYIFLNCLVTKGKVSRSIFNAFYENKKINQTILLKP
jgi:hypothetical protein